MASEIGISLCADLQRFHSIAADQLAVQELKRQIGGLSVEREQLLDHLDRDRAALDEPVITEVSKEERLGPGLRIRHVFRNHHGLAHDRIVAAAPEIIAGVILQFFQRVSGFIVHDPDAVFAVFRFDGKVQVDHAVVGQSG